MSWFLASKKWEPFIWGISIGKKVENYRSVILESISRVINSYVLKLQRFWKNLRRVAQNIAVYSLPDMGDATVGSLPSLWLRKDDDFLKGQNI